MRHWSEVMTCQCGATFRSASAEARHRHNFPALCRKPRARQKRRKTPAKDHVADAGKKVGEHV